MAGLFDDILNGGAPQQVQPSSNPFDDILASDQTGQEKSNMLDQQFGQIVEAEAKEAGSSFNDKLDQFNRGFEKYAVGGLQLFNGAVESTLGNLPFIGGAIKKSQQEFGQQLGQYNEAQKANYQAAAQRHPAPVIDALGNIGGAALASAPGMLAATTAGPVGFGGMVAQGAAGGISAGAMDEAGSIKERLTNMVTGGASGAAFSGALGLGGMVLSKFAPNTGVSSYIKKLFDPSGAAKLDISDAIKKDYANNADDAIVAINKSPDIGGTPGELVGTSNKVSKIKELESKISLNEGDKGQIAESIVGRTEAAKKGIYDTINKMDTPELQATKTTSFKNMESDFIGQDGALTNVGVAGKPEFIKNNEILSKTYDEVIGANVSKWKDLPQNSVAQLHKVKDVLDDQLIKSQPNVNTGTIAKEISLTKQKELIEAKQAIEGVLKQSDSYNAAMASTNSIKRSEYYKQMIDKVRGETGEGDLPLDKLASAVMPNVLRSRIFLKDAIKAGADPEQTKELIKVAQSLKGSPLWSALKSGSKAKGGGDGSVQSMNFIQKIVSDMTLDKYYKALTEVTLSGDKWKPQIVEVLKSGSLSNKQAALLQLMKTVSVGTSSAVGEKVGNVANQMMGNK